MKLTFTTAELTAIRQTNLKIAHLIGELPGAEAVARQLREQAETPINPEKIMRDLDPSQVKIYWEDESDDLSIWINPEAVSEALDLVVDQYSIVVEIGVALYPIIRLAKRMLTDLGKKFADFGERFARKLDKRLGAAVPVKSGGFEGAPIGWREGVVVAARGHTVVVRLKSSGLYIVATQDGELYYAASPEASKISDFFENETLSDAPNWDFA